MPGHQPRAKSKESAGGLRRGDAQDDLGDEFLE